MKFLPAPTLIVNDRPSRKLKRLKKVHEEFDEAFLQELLVTNPELLPVDQLRDDVGELLCIGREVPMTGVGAIDNLYLSTGGYPVVVETKLWRNPEARRTVLSQILDYTKEIVQKDFSWFDEMWQGFSKDRYGTSGSLLSRLDELAGGEFDDATFVDRVHRALSMGDVLSLIVGDGIETKLQELVDHLCRDSAHLRYSLALVELACYKVPIQDVGLLVVPRIVQEVDPVERAYVRIELEEGIAENLKVQSVVPESRAKERTSSGRRANLTEDEFYNELDSAIGVPLRQRIELFCQELVEDSELEIDVKSAQLVLKVADPSGKKPSASLISIHRLGRMYNSAHMRKQLMNWGIPEERAAALCNEYWHTLHNISTGFKLGGISLHAVTEHVPIQQLVDKLSDLKNAISEFAAKIRIEAEEAESE